MNTLLDDPNLNGKRYRHRKGGTYTVLFTGFIEATLTHCVIYISHQDGVVWVRPLDEFLDGRFECLDEH